MRIVLNVNDRLLRCLSPPSQRPMKTIIKHLKPKNNPINTKKIKKKNLYKTFKPMLFAPAHLKQRMEKSFKNNLKNLFTPFPVVLVLLPSQGNQPRQTKKVYQMKSKVQKVMANIIESFDTIKTNSYNREEMKKQRNILATEIETLPLKRDKLACYNMLRALEDNREVYQITLAYVYDGKFYPVRKNIPGCAVDGTDYLHTLNLNSQNWDDMQKVSVWVHSGIIV